MRRFVLAPVVIAAAIAAAACNHTSHVETHAFAWTGVVPAGQWIRLRNVSGAIVVQPSSTDSVQVLATKRWRGSDHTSFGTATGTDGVTVCTLARPGETCDGSGDSRHVEHFTLFGHNATAEVDYVVRVPPGVNVDVLTITGPIDVSGATGAVQAHTVSGSVRATAYTAPMELQSVNGDVTATIDSLHNPGDIDLETVNGSVVATLPASLDAALKMSTVSGQVTSDFPAAVPTKDEPREVTATLGNGGRRVEISTVHGSVVLRRGT